MYEDCLKVARRINEDPLLNSYPPLLCGGKLRDDPIFSIAMGMNGFICHSEPKKSKCIALPSKYTVNKIDIIGGSLDVTDKNGRKLDDCALLHFSTRKALEEGLYLWQTVLLYLHKKNCRLYKVLNNKIFYTVCELLRKTEMIIKLISKKN